MHGIFPFSKSYPQIESTWSTAKCRRRKSFDTYCIVICATVCVSFWSKSEASNAFPKHVLKSKARGQSIQSRKKLFCHMTVKNCFCSVSCKFFIKIVRTWRCAIKEQTPQLVLLYCSRTVRSSRRMGSIKKVVFKIS